jgi:hypothetical protein
VEETVLASDDSRKSRDAAQRSAVADLSSQLASLKCDLHRFTVSHSSPVLTESIKDRIRQIEAQLARTQASSPPPVREAPDAADRAAVYATAPRYASRPHRAG